MTNTKTQGVKSFLEFSSGPSYAELRQALAEADKIESTAILDESTEHKVFNIKPVSNRVETDSTKPGYDKRTAYAIYGKPTTENKEGTASNIANHEKITGRPASPTTRKALKAFKHETNGEGISKLFRLYGHADPKLIPSEDRKSEITSNFREYADLRKNNPEEYARRVKEMRSKKLGEMLGNKTKTDTVADLPGINKGEENGHETLGFGGNPDIRRHYTDLHGNYVNGNACHGKGNCVHSCLAKNGCGGFESVKGHRDFYDQRSSHNAAARKDHDLELFHQLHEISKKAKKNNKGVIVRPDVTTGHQQTEYADAISEHFGPHSAGVKAGTHAVVRSDTYGKMAGTDKDPHSREKAINTAISDQGVPANKRDVDAHIKLNSLLRRRGKDARVAYTVMKVTHRQDNKDGTEKIHNNPKDAENWKKVMNVTSTRRYDILHSTPGTGEGENPNETRKEYHDEKNRNGRVTHEGKSYYYTDHRVPAPLTDTKGKRKVSSYHDARGLELAHHILNHPNEHGINAVSPATASTSFKEGPSIFHNPDNISDNTLHILHPASPEAAKAREILTRTKSLKEASAARRRFGDKFRLELKESKMGEVHDAIMSKFPDKHDVEIQDPEIHTHSNYNQSLKREEKRKYVVYPVTFYEKPKTSTGWRQPRQTTVHHPIGDHTDVRMGLPKRLGGDIIRVT